jgi:zinc transport system substrate-binding protein
LCAACGTALVVTGCGDVGARNGGDVVAAFYPLAFVSEEVAGPGASVSTLTPPGAEPHDLELSARDVGRVRDARLVVFVGGGFQPGLEGALGERDGPSLDVLEGLDLLPGADQDEVDPHVWLDPVRYAAIAREVAAALGDPAGADDLVARLEGLDREYRSALERCVRRELVTSHAAFGYLADRYGLRQVPLVGIAPESEPGPREIERLVDEVRRTRATTVFTESLVSPELAETIAREAGVSTAVLDPLEGLTSERLESGADYFTVMRENLATLREALGCT